MNCHHFLQHFPMIQFCVYTECVSVFQVPAVTRRPTRSGRLGVDKQGEYTYKNVSPLSLPTPGLFLILTEITFCEILKWVFKLRSFADLLPLFSEIVSPSDTFKYTNGISTTGAASFGQLLNPPFSFCTSFPSLLLCTNVHVVMDPYNNSMSVEEGQSTKFAKLIV